MEDTAMSNCIGLQVIKQGGGELVRGSERASGHDLRVAITTLFAAGETVVVKTGVKLQMPNHLEAQVRPRSSASRNGWLVHFGTIDSDYRGEIGVIVTNLSCEDRWLEEGIRIAQLCFAYVPQVQIVDGIVDETERGDRGFGSSGLR
ncbi:MAG: dUTP diphosphatase [Chloroflexia bacterium]|nr:dUTP diphosphatase [Chloroflexia bacterium]